MSQPAPQPGGAAILPMVIADLEERGRRGLDTYGVPLSAHNGRDALADVYDELLDAAQYIKQEMVERQWEDTYLLEALRRMRAEVRYWKKRAEDAERRR